MGTDHLFPLVTTMSPGMPCSHCIAKRWSLGTVGEPAVPAAVGTKSLLVGAGSAGVSPGLRELTACLSPSLVLQTGKRVGKVLHASLRDVLRKEESLGPTRPKVGFLG